MRTSRTPISLPLVQVDSAIRNLQECASWQPPWTLETSVRRTEVVSTPPQIRTQHRTAGWRQLEAHAPLSRQENYFSGHGQERRGWDGDSLFFHRSIPIGQHAPRAGRSSQSHHRYHTRAYRKHSPRHAERPSVPLPDAPLV